MEFQNINDDCHSIFPLVYRFINLQADAIHRTDPDALVSVGVWNPIDNTDAFGLHDLFKDECLVAAGGKEGVGNSRLL